MLLCLCKAFVFITFTRRILFLIYQFQFLSLCHSREAEDILKYLVVVIPAARVLTLLYSVFQPTTPW